MLVASPAPSPAPSGGATVSGAIDGTIEVRGAGDAHPAPGALPPVLIVASAASDLRRVPLAQATASPLVKSVSHFRIVGLPLGTLLVVRVVQQAGVRETLAFQSLDRPGGTGVSETCGVTLTPASPLGGCAFMAVSLGPAPVASATPVPVPGFPE